MSLKGNRAAERGKKWFDFFFFAPSQCIDTMCFPIRMGKDSVPQPSQGHKTLPWRLWWCPRPVVCGEQFCQDSNRAVGVLPLSFAARLLCSAPPISFFLEADLWRLEAAGGCDTATATRFDHVFPLDKRGKKLVLQHFSCPGKKDHMFSLNASFSCPQLPRPPAWCLAPSPGEPTALVQVPRLQLLNLNLASA